MGMKVYQVAAYNETGQCVKLKIKANQAKSGNCSLFKTRKADQEMLDSLRERGYRTEIYSNKQWVQLG